MSNLKKFFFFSLFIFAISLLFWGVYTISFKTSSSGNVAKTPEKNSSKPESEGVVSREVYVNKIAPITSGEALDPVFFKDENKIRYFSPDEKSFFEIELDGSGKRKLAEMDSGKVVQVIWSPDASRAIFKVKNSDDTFSFYAYTVSSGQKEEIAKSMDEVAWQSNSKRIFYKYYDPATRTRSLNISDPDGSNWKEIAKISYRNLSVAQIPQTGLVSFWNSGQASQESDFKYVPIIGGEEKPISSGRYGADYLWNNSGNSVLVSFSETKDGNKIGLGVMDYKGENFRNLDTPTFVSKCVWSKDGKFVYLALPQNISGVVLPDDYKSAKAQTADTFWRVNISNGEKERLVEVSDIKSEFDAQNLFLNTDESLLFFTNRKDGKLYRINL